MKYHKIQSVYKRDEKGKFTSEYSTDEFYFLEEHQWYGTEKIDGTNIRIEWDGMDYTIAGRTDKAQIPEHLFEVLKDIACGIDWSMFDGPVTLFGEGCGPKIQKHGERYGDTPQFILFDVFCGIWLTHGNVERIANIISVPYAPLKAMGTIPELELMVRDGMKSSFGDFDAEGLVLRPFGDLRTRRGDRIITKLKTKDFT